MRLHVAPMGYLYTVIIPHHNIPHLLRRCLHSIPQRDDVQVIVVDDRSNDECLQVLQKIEIEYSWVTFIYSHEGGGAGKVRNIGLLHAKGRYVLFADADDFFNYCIGQIFDEYVNKHYDIVFFNANSVDTDTYELTFRNLHLNGMIKFYDKNRNMALKQLRYAFGEPWCKMVKREIIEKNNIRFSETIIHNDTKYSYLVGFYCKNAHVDKRAVYCVTDRTGSVSKRVSLDRLLTRVAVFSEANSFFKANKIKHFEERGLRPLIGFIIKGEWTHAKQCIEIMKKAGFTDFSILSQCVCYPFYLIGKSRTVFQKVVLNILHG